MSDYKLVPVEPTLDMLHEGMDVYGTEGCADADVHAIYASMIGAAPAFPVDPVGWQLDLPDGRVFLEKEYPEWAEGGDGYRIAPLYAAPQMPAAVQPGDECSRCKGKGRHATGPIDCPAITICKLCSAPISRNLRGVHAMILSALDRDAGDGKAVRGEMASELRSAIAYQQPAPDVGGMVGALEEALKGRPLDTEFWNRCERFIAYYRGQGGDV